MSVDKRGNVMCDVCGTKIYNGIPYANRQVGNDGYAMCDDRCLAQFEITHANVSSQIEAAVEEAERLGADEQRGWKVARWWNQAYKRKKKVWEQFKTQREFQKIQRKARRGS